MITEEAIIHEYEMTLLGKKKVISKNFFTGLSKLEKRRLTLIVFKYAFENYMHWSHTEVRDNISLEVLHYLHLKQLVKYIDFPVELDEETDLFYIAWLLYPETINITGPDLTLKQYKDVLEGKRAKVKKEYFNGAAGEFRAGLCLYYLIQNYLPYGSIEELYAYFASTKGSTLLRQYRLSSVCKQLFDTPLHFLHVALPVSQKIPFLYHYYSFLNSTANKNIYLTREE